MGQVSNRFFVTSIKDGTIVTAAIYCDKPLVQLIDEQNVSDPDWTIAANQPTVWCVTRTGATIKTPSSFTWKVNDTAILFPANPTPGVSVSTNFDGAFMYMTKTIDGKNVPCIKIIKNIITWDNADNDILVCEGAMEYNGADIGYSVSTTIRRGELSSSGYFGWIEGDSYVTAQSGASGTAYMYAHLKTAEGTVTSFSTKWFREGVTPSGRWTAEGRSANPSSGVATMDILGSEITDYVVVRCDFYDTTGAKIYSAYWDVDDMEDEEEMYMASYNDNSEVSNGLDVCLRTDQVVTYLAWVGKRGDQTIIDSKYTIFKVKLLDYEGNTITSLTSSGVEKKNSSGNWTAVVNADVDSSGYITITTSTTKTGYNGGNSFACGMIKIPASFADAHGGRITGIVTAMSAS